MKNMNFEEAKQQLIDNGNLLDVHIMHDTKPAHRVVCSFVSVLTNNRDIHELLFEAIHDRHLDNKEHIDSLGLLNSSMIPMVVVLMQGINNIMTLEHYLEFVSAQNSL